MCHVFFGHPVNPIHSGLVLHDRVLVIWQPFAPVKTHRMRMVYDLMCGEATYCIQMVRICSSVCVAVLLHICEDWCKLSVKGLLVLSFIILHDEQWKLVSERGWFPLLWCDSICKWHGLYTSMYIILKLYIAQTTVQECTLLITKTRPRALLYVHKTSFPITGSTVKITVRYSLRPGHPEHCTNQATATVVCTLQTMNSDHCSHNSKHSLWIICTLQNVIGDRVFHGANHGRWTPSHRTRCTSFHSAHALYNTKP